MNPYWLLLAIPVIVLAVGLLAVTVSWIVKDIGSRPKMPA